MNNKLEKIYELKIHITQMLLKEMLLLKWKLDLLLKLI